MVHVNEGIQLVIRHEVHSTNTHCLHNAGW